MKVEEIKDGYVQGDLLVKEYMPHSQYINVSDADYNLFLAQAYDVVREDDFYVREAHSRPETGLTREQEVNRLSEISNELDTLFEGNAKFFRTDIVSPKDTGDCVVNSGEAAIQLLCRSRHFYSYAPVLKRHAGLCLILRDVVNYSEEYRVFVVNGSIIKISQEKNNNVDDFELILNSFENNLIDKNKEGRIKAYAKNIIKECGIEYGVLDVGVTDTDQLMIVSHFIEDAS